MKKSNFSICYFIKGFLATGSLAASMAAWSNLELAPPAFTANQRGEKAVFVDFTKANYVVEYDVRGRSAKAQAQIQFSQKDEGLPIFDLVPSAKLVKVDGLSTSASAVKAPNNTTEYKLIQKSLMAGEHSLEVANDITTNIEYSPTAGSVKSAFWMSDLTDRNYLEQYLPTNLEFDQYDMELEVKVLGTSLEHVLFTNGEVVEVAKNHWKIHYPEHFTSSSIFYHLMPKGSIPMTKFTYKSIDGRNIPVTVYTKSLLESFKSNTIAVLNELEKDYGAWPHAQVIVYGAGQGGMEHCGATMTSLSALGHELTHSYFARGVMPARGNSGWIDEAVASWRDEGYPSRNANQIERTVMGAHSDYRRTTDMDAYDAGERFIGYLHAQFYSQGGMKAFLREFKNKRLFKPILTDDFQQDLEERFNADLDALFKKYIYGQEGVSEQVKHVRENPNHPKLSAQELMNLL